MLWLHLLAALWVVGVSHGDSDSLRSALESIDRRQHNLDSDPGLYFIDRFHPSALVYTARFQGDGQPENIGYGYQKSSIPKTSGVFEAIPLPERELGSHDPGVESHLPDGKSFENIILDYIEDNMGSHAGSNAERYNHQNRNPDSKRSVFRERDVNELPDSLQNLYAEGDNSKQYFDNGEHPHVLPSSFRERLSTKPSIKSRTRNAQALVRNFGGLDRDSEDFPDSDTDSDEYLSVLNSIWEKYQQNNPDEFDPEDLTESDIDEILSYINHKEEKKRQPDYDDIGYDFFNSPLAWVKRKRQHSDNSKHIHSGKLESLQEEDMPDDERNQEVAKLLMDDYRQNSDKRYVKRFWRGNTYEDHHHNVKRYPIAKRSSNFYTSPAVLYHKASTDRFNQRRKKNANSHASDGKTDPQVTVELSDIFSPSYQSKLVNNKTVGTFSNKSSDNANITQISKEKPIKVNSTKTSLNEEAMDHIHTTHVHTKRSGQEEETEVDSQHRPLEMSKKSVDWSNYFGIDRRRKKSSKPVNNQWLLDQYLKAYSISARAVKDSGESKDEVPRFEIDKKSSDDMDAKLQAMENMIVDQALKYTGAHEGTTDSQQVQEVKDRVIAQLAAAYSLEKMRKALSEFKSSIAAQKLSSGISEHTTTNAPDDESEQKKKRLAVKKEKAGSVPEIKPENKNEQDNGISAIHTFGPSRPTAWSQEDESCPIMEDIGQRCREVARMSDDHTESLLSLCSLHQVCYLCGSELGVSPSSCDVTFMSEANNICDINPRCRYTARRTMAAMHMIRGDPSSAGCAWQTHPCLARFLSAIMR